MQPSSQSSNLGFMHTVRAALENDDHVVCKTVWAPACGLVFKKAEEAIGAKIVIGFEGRDGEAAGHTCDGGGALAKVSGQFYRNFRIKMHASFPARLGCLHTVYLCDRLYVPAAVAMVQLLASCLMREKSGCLRATQLYSVPSTCSRSPYTG